MIVGEKRADIVGAEGERIKSERAGIGMDIITEFSGGNGEMKTEEEGQTRQ